MKSIRKPRAGFTLVELVLALGIGSLILGVAVGFFVACSSMSKKTWNTSSRVEGVATLSLQILRDIRASDPTTLRLGKGGWNRLALELRPEHGGGFVEYWVEVGGVQRWKDDELDGVYPLGPGGDLVIHELWSAQSHLDTGFLIFSIVSRGEGGEERTDLPVPLPSNGRGYWAWNPVLRSGGGGR